MIRDFTNVRSVHRADSEVEATEKPSKMDKSEAESADVVGRAVDEDYKAAMVQEDLHKNDGDKGSDDDVGLDVDANEVQVDANNEGNEEAGENDDVANKKDAQNNENKEESEKEKDDDPDANADDSGAGPQADDLWHMHVVVPFPDDWRKNSVGAKNLIIKTPFLDSLDNKGIRFRQNTVTTSICWQSRATLLNGQWASRHRPYTLKCPRFAKGQYRNNPWPALLQKDGYFVGHVRKWQYHSDTLRGRIDRIFLEKTRLGMNPSKF